MPAKITLWQKFWLAVCRFAYRRARLTPERTPTGLPGHRDPAAKCDQYTPLKRNEIADGQCEGDGHYLCKECWHLSRESPNHPDNEP